MDKSTTTRNKSEELNKRIEDLEKEFTSTSVLSLSRTGWCYLGSVLGIPLLVFLALFCSRPFFVLTQKKEGGVRDRKKLVRWTLVFTLAAYSAVYFYACYRSAPPVSFSPEILKS